MTLHDLGFSAVQEAAYRALLQDPAMDTAALAALAAADERTVRAALNGLAELGAIRPDPRAPAGFSAANPAVAIGELIERLEDESLRHQRRVSGTRTELAGLMALKQRRLADDMAGLETVIGLKGVREKLAELSFFTRSSVWAIQPAGTHSVASRAAATQLDERSLRRGVDMRIIYDIALLGSAHSHSSLRHRATAGARIRLRRGPLQRLIIMDERVAVVPADPADARQGALIVRQAGLLHGLRELFLLSWESAQDLPHAAADEPRLAAGDQVVLELLAAGATDEMAARQVGISVRHFRRQVARLMEELQAGSRFQAGVAATRRGWT